MTLNVSNSIIYNFLLIDNLFDVVLFLLTLFFSFSRQLTTALTASLQDAWYEDEFIIAMSNIKEKNRRSGGPMKTLLAVKYRDARTKMMLLVDRQTKRGEPTIATAWITILRTSLQLFTTLTLVVPVMLESLDETGRRSASHVKVDSLAVNTPVKSLIILVHQAQPNPRVDVYVDCIYEGSIPLKKTFRDIAETEDNPSVEVVSFYFPRDIFRNFGSNKS